MIDEKKMEEAADKYADMYLDMEDEEQPSIGHAAYKAFIAGINWFLGNLWHGTSEESKEGLLLVEYYGGLMNLFALKQAKDCHFPNSGIKRYLCIDDLLKGGSHE